MKNKWLNMRDRVQLLTGKGVWINLIRSDILAIGKTVGEDYAVITMRNGKKIIVEHSYQDIVKKVYGEKK